MSTRPEKRRLPQTIDAFCLKCGYSLVHWEDGWKHNAEAPMTKRHEPDPDRWLDERKYPA